MSVQHYSHSCAAFAAALIALFCTAVPLLGAPAERVTVKLPPPDRYPRVAATPPQLAMLRQGYKTSDHWRKVLTKTFLTPAREAMDKPLFFPPRGGQHGQWYRCPIDATPLQTINMHEHRCPKCGKVFSGLPYDEVVYERIHRANLKAARQAAWAYAITGDQSFAQFADQVLAGYGKRYMTYPYHDSRLRQGGKASRSGGHLFEQTLNEASVLMRDIAPAYDLIRPTLSADDRHTIEEGLIRPMLENIARCPRGTSNWQSFHNGAMLWGGAMLGNGEAKWIDQAINDPKNGFLFQMKHAVTSDGVWHEGSWSYHRYTLTALVWTARGAENLGMDLWHNPSLDKMFLIQMRYAMPDGALPRLGDASEPSIAGSAIRIEPIYHAIHDKRLIPLLPAKTGWLALMYGNLHIPGRGVFVMPKASDQMPAAGDIVLRTDGKAKLTLAASYDGNRSFHAHYDQLSFVFYGFGQELAVDPGCEAPQAYNSAIHREWYKSTISHNTVLVDGKNQTPAPGKLLSLHFNDSYAAAVMQVRGAYQGVTQTRLLVMTPTYLLVFDQLASDTPHRYTWLYHNTGEMIQGSDDLTPISFTDQKDGRRYLRHARQKTIDDNAVVRFMGDKVAVDVVLSASGPATLTLANGPKQNIKTRVPLVMLSQENQRDAWFAAVLQPRQTKNHKGASAGLPAPTIKMERGKDGSTIFRVGSDVIYLNHQHHVRVEHDGKPVLIGTDQP